MRPNLPRLSANPYGDTLQIQTLRLALLFRAEHSLSRRPEIRHLYPHAAFSERQQTRLRANGLDVSTREVVLLRDELLQVDVFVEAHLGRVQSKDLSLRHLVGVLEQDLSVDTSGSNQGGIQSLDLVGGHNDLDVASVVETVELVQKLQHGSLDFSLTARGGIVSLRTDGIDFVDEDDGRRVFTRNLGAISTQL